MIGFGTVLSRSSVVLGIGTNGKGYGLKIRGICIDIVIQLWVTASREIPNCLYIMATINKSLAFQHLIFRKKNNLA